MREILHLALRLLVFCLAAGVLLAATNALTSGPIARQAELTAQNARKQVLTEASSFRRISDGGDPDYPHLTAVYEGVDRDGTVGYTFSLAPMGFKAVIEMTLGINREGAITALSVDSQSETAGLGTKITTDAYLTQYQGAAADSATLAAQIDGITGATVTSKAVVSAVGEAVRYAEQELGLTGKADQALAGSRYLTEDELRLVSLVDGGRTIASLPPYQALGYDALEAAYRIDVRGSDAYVLTLRAQGELYEAAFDEKGRVSLFLASGEGTGCSGCERGAEALTSGEEALREPLAQAMDFYDRYLAEGGN